MSEIVRCEHPEDLPRALREARRALSAGSLVVTPTDTVYGVAADAFAPAAVQRLLDAKGRGRDFPPPVLIPELATMDALAADIPQLARTLAEKFWPGALTLVLTMQPSLSWDLGDTGGTVALRIPDLEVCRELLRDTGPLAVSSANTHGQPAAMTAEQAQAMLGDAVEVYLDGGRAPGGTASTILDLTRVNDGGPIRVLRRGAIPVEEIRAVAGATEVDG
ncbi:MAG TPA: threonylcarbamoyl-AMP synthase [Pseudoclavibacter sp.]|nr:threonylcarbamoyl-AMP synthase [Pseudoclavibacter sp.]